MRWKGSKVGYFWTIDPSGTCANAVCSCLSQCQHGVVCQVKPCGSDCPSQLWKSHSQIFKLLRPLKISQMFIRPAIKHNKELWRVEDRARSEHMKSVRAEAAIKKGEAVPLQAWSSPEGSRKLRFPDFMTTAQDGGKVVSLMHRPPLSPENTPGTHSC